MFTGIIEDIGTIKSISDTQITIETKLDDIAIGDSIAVNGVCLTAVLIKQNLISFDYSPHTDTLTNLSLLKANSKVNIERALKLSSRLGGHIVSGHIDGSAKISKIEKMQRFYRVIFDCDENISRYCIDNGSIVVDGISLTISKAEKSFFEIYIIPETFNSTCMQFRKIQDLVNVETDVIGKYLEKFTQNKKTEKISLEMLRGNGFV